MNDWKGKNSNHFVINMDGSISPLGSAKERKLFLGIKGQMAEDHEKETSQSYYMMLG